MHTKISGNSRVSEEQSGNTDGADKGHQASSLGPILRVLAYSSATALGTAALVAPQHAEELLKPAISGVSEFLSLNESTVLKRVYLSRDKSEIILEHTDGRLESLDRAKCELNVTSNGADGDFTLYRKIELDSGLVVTYVTTPADYWMTSYPEPLEKLIVQDSGDAVAQYLDGTVAVFNKDEYRIDGGSGMAIQDPNQSFVTYWQVQPEGRRIQVFCPMPRDNDSSKISKSNNL